MVDVSSQNGNASIKVSSSGVTSSINATPDMALYYSEKSREYSESAKKYADEGKGYLDSAVIAIENKKNIAIQEIDNAFAELGGDLSDVKIVADNIETVQTIGENVENILNKTVDVGDTLTSEAGTEAKVVNVGTKFAPVLEFTIPRGDNGVDGGMDATYDEETQTLSFYSEKGNAFYPKWGTITGDIASQKDLKTALEKVASSSVDLTDYVKNTDYATDTVGGVVKISGNYFGLALNSSKQLYINKAMDTEVTAKVSHYKPIVPSNLDLAVKTGVTTNTIELTDNEKTSACNWLGTAKTVSLTQADYDALATKDANTLYLIEE